jgi:DNA processing protein
MALGTDAIAHEACLSVGAPSLAVLVSDVSNPVPKTNHMVAKHIYENGFMISENNSSHTIQKHDFLIRNRLISGLAMGVVVPQASARSGSLNTVRHALEQGRVVMAVPGPITNPLCEGPNNLLKMGATTVTSADDVLKALNIVVAERGQKDYELSAESEQELTIIRLLLAGETDGEAMAGQSGLSAQQFNVHLTMLEIRGVITPLGANHWALS